MQGIVPSKLASMTGEDEFEDCGAPSRVGFINCRVICSAGRVTPFKGPLSAKPADHDEQPDFFRYMLVC